MARKARRTRGATRSVRWEVTYRDPVTGRERTAGGFRTAADANRWAGAMETDQARGDWIDPTLARVPFRDYAAGWLATKADVSPRTRINVEGRLRNHLLPAFGNVELGKIAPSDVRAFLAQLTASGRAPSTVRPVFHALRAIFATAVIDRVLARNPCDGVALPRERRREPMGFLTAHEVEALADAIDDRYRALVYLAAYGGLRAGELVALRVEHLRPLAGTLDVVASAAEVHGRVEVGPTKTGRVRTITLPGFLAAMLGEHVGRYPSEDGLVFTSPEGGPLRWRNFYARRFRPAVARAGLDPGLRFHRLRHTCAALLIAAGRHLEEVKALLGHSSIRVTSDRYGHLFPEARQAMAASLEATYRAAAAARPTSPPATVVQLAP